MYLIVKNIRNNKLFSLLLLVSFFISFLSISFAAILTESKQDFAHSSDIGFQGYNKSILVPIMNEQNLTAMTKVIQTTFPTSDVYVENLSLTNNYGSTPMTAVYAKEHYYWKPALSKGQFLNGDHARTVVLGNQTKREDFGDLLATYKQVGTVKRTDTDLGISIVYLPLQQLPSSVKEAIISSGEIQLTVVNPTSSIKSETAHFATEMKKTLGTEITVKNALKTDTTVSGIDKTNQYFYKFIIVSIVSGVSTLLFWIHKKQKEISLKKALGASNLDIYREFCAQILLIAAVALALVFLTIKGISQPIHIYFETYKNHLLSPYVVLFDLGLVVFLIMIISIIPIKHIVNIYPSQELKG
ncbi:FtsX-like permease family protein [Priestia koreensis]|uniref:FtsX-like permease family protein n=1 Tax=Priestia koreensis TaxID=284581 RepID=UPI003CFEB54C